MEETVLSHSVELGEDHPQGVTIKTAAKMTNKFSVSIPNLIFQRFYVYDSGLIICDEVFQGSRFIRSNREINLENDVATF